MSSKPTRHADRNEVKAAIFACSRWFWGVAIFSAVVNILYLASSIYMLQVYDRVLASRSTATLIALSLLLLVAYLVQGNLDTIRQRMLARIGARFNEILAPRVFQVVSEIPLRGRKTEATMPVSDLDAIRNFLAGLGPTAMFDMPFMPIFLFAAFFLHPLLGWLTVAGAVTIVFLTVFAEARSRAPAKSSMETTVRRNSLVETSRRNAEALQALGMRPVFRERFLEVNAAHVASSLQASDVIFSLNTFAKTFRYVLQSAALGLGAYLAINGEISAGSIIAASILTSRALAPVEVVVAHWKGFLSARLAYRRLADCLGAFPEPGEHVRLPDARSTLAVQSLALIPPSGGRVIIEGVSFELMAGDGLGLIGSTGSGKSTLARGIVGVWTPFHGTVRLDGATLDQWGDQLGGQIGYLPQDVELFAGTVAENISRFSRSATDASIVEAARAAEAHDLILQLPQGYSTPVADGGIGLSGGQRQRIALARALYGNPFLVVLDEPNANLDGQGDEALTAAILAVRRRNGIAIIVTHRPSGLAAVNKVGVMHGGRLVQIGPRDAVLANVSGRPKIAASGGQPDTPAIEKEAAE